MSNKDLDQERELVIELLAGHYAEDRLELEAYEERVEQAEAATSEQELRKLVVDLEPAEEPAEAGGAMVKQGGGPMEKVPTSTALVPASEVPEKRTVIAVFGGPSRKGAWAVPKRLNVRALFGGAEIDLREARLSHGVTEINCYCLMGGVHIIVPPELKVDVEGNGIMGSFDDRTDQGLYEKMQTCSIRVTGVAVMGGVEIEERLPGESRREAKKRFKTRCKERMLQGRKRLK
jgi:hypothetical protein